MFNLLIFLAFLGREQPPPRGCVLKQRHYLQMRLTQESAASARLCVETVACDNILENADAAASARLCVETCDLPHTTQTLKAATFGWLCVETAHTFAYVGWQARAATFG